MALPAVQEGNPDLSMVVGEIKDLVDGVVENLTAIKITQMDMARGIGDLVAKAELDFEQMADAEAESLDAEVVDAEAASVMDSNDGTVIDLLMEIKDAVKETAEYTKTSADADKEASEDVLKDDLGDPTKREGSKAAEGGDKAVKQQGSLIQKVLGGLLGLFAGLFVGWLKALKFVFNRGFLAKFGTFFTNFFKNLKTKFSGGKLAKGFARIGQFFKSIGSFFGRIFKVIKPIFSFFKSIISIAGRVMGIVSKIFAPLLIIGSIFETIRGFFDGFANTEGNFLEKLMGGIAGALTGFLDFLIAAPVNLIFDLIGWIAGLFGFEGVKEKLQGIDFSFGGIIDAIFGIIKFVTGIAFKILKFPVALAAGIGGGIAALVPGGKSPKEGFMDAFNAVMNFGEGEPKAPNLTEAEPDAASLSSESSTNDEAEPIKDNVDKGTTGSTKAEGVSMYPFNLKGFKDQGLDQDEYTITGRRDDGVYIGTDADGEDVEFPMGVNQFITNAVEGRRDAMEVVERGTGPAQMEDGGPGITGTGIGSRSEELAAQRAQYAGGFNTGFNMSSSTTNAPTTVVNSSTSTTIPDSDDSIKGRLGGSSGVGTPS